jgi:hypothetical protein
MTNFLSKQGKREKLATSKPLVSKMRTVPEDGQDLLQDLPPRSSDDPSSSAGSNCGARSSRTNELVGQFVDEGVRSPAIIFRHISGCSARPGFHCDCLFARMNFNEMGAFDAAAQSGLKA